MQTQELTGMIKSGRIHRLALFGAMLLAVTSCAPIDDDDLGVDGGDIESHSQAIKLGARYSDYASYNIYDGVPASGVKCNESPKRFNMMVTALRRDLFRSGGATCGKCAKVTSTTQGGGYGKTITVRIIDESNDFSNNGGHRLLDLSAQAFAKLGDRNRGFIPVSFEIVSCPSGLR